MLDCSSLVLIPLISRGQEANQGGVILEKVELLRATSTSLRL